MWPSIISNNHAASGAHNLYFWGPWNGLMRHHCNPARRDIKSLTHANTASRSLSVSHTCGLTPTFTLEKSQLTLHVKISLHAKFSVTVLCNCPGTLTVFIGGRVTTQSVLIKQASLTCSPELTKEETISPGQWRRWWKLSPAEVSTVKYTLIYTIMMNSTSKHKKVKQKDSNSTGTALCLIMPLPAFI